MHSNFLIISNELKIAHGRLLTGYWISWTKEPVSWTFQLQKKNRVIKYDLVNIKNIFTASNGLSYLKDELEVVHTSLSVRGHLCDGLIFLA